jgi:ubiquitin-protein ligase
MLSDEVIDRLRDEYASLIQLQRRSKFIKIRPVDQSPGMPPNKYVVTYTCRGIAGITENKEPVPSDWHEVEIYLDHNFPTSEPSLTWLTPIWHPNIEHYPPYTVCTDNIKSWYPMRSLNMLVIALGEMIQYKKYHAKHESPYPIDHEVADWVIDYAEKRNIVGEGKPYDKRALIRRLLDNPIGPKRETQKKGEVELTPIPSEPKPEVRRPPRPRVILSPRPGSVPPRLPDGEAGS